MMEKKSKYLISAKDIEALENTSKNTTLPGVALTSSNNKEQNHRPPRQLDLAARTLWIGNVDHRLTEFNLLKLLQKFGKLESFDYLYHKTGPDRGKPRGFCFATYATKQEADAAKNGMDGKLALGRTLVVHYAYKERKEDPCQKTDERQRVRNMDPSSQIQAIEAKLRVMEQEANNKTFYTPTPSTSNSSSSNTARSMNPKPYSHSRTTR